MDTRTVLLILCWFLSYTAIAKLGPFWDLELHDEQKVKFQYLYWPKVWNAPPLNYLFSSADELRLAIGVTELAISALLAPLQLLGFFGVSRAMLVYLSLHLLAASGTHVVLDEAAEMHDSAALNGLAVLLIYSSSSSSRSGNSGNNRPAAGDGEMTKSKVD